VRARHPPPLCGKPRDAIRGGGSPVQLGTGGAADLPELARPARSEAGDADDTHHSDGR